MVLDHQHRGAVRGARTRITSTSSGTSSALTPAIGSSSSITRGSPASSSAISSLRFSPWESARPARGPGRRGRRGRAPRRRPDGDLAAAPAATAASSRRGAPARRAGRSRARSASRRPRPGRYGRGRAGARRCGGSPVMSRPAARCCPPSVAAQPGDQVEQRGLAGAVRADDAEELARATASETSSTIWRRRCRARGCAWRGSERRWPRSCACGQPATGLPAGRRLPLDPRDHLGLPLAVRCLDQLDLEHRLEQRVVGGTDRLLALDPVEAPALERGDHLVDVVALAPCERADDHLRGDEAVRGEQVGHLAALAQRPAGSRSPCSLAPSK